MMCGQTLKIGEVVCLCSQGVILDTLVHNHPANKGSQWAILKRTHEGIYAYNGGPCVHEQVDYQNQRKQSNSYDLKAINMS